MSENRYIVKNLIKQFIAFLKKNDAYTKFLHNVEKEMSVHFKKTKEPVKDYLMRKWLNATEEHSSTERTYVSDFLGGAFVWGYTAEGHGYWETLNKQWKKEMIRGYEQ